MHADHAEELLKSRGLKCTRQREAVLSLLEESAQPQTAEQVYLALRGGEIPINLSSVYRILDTLVEKGLLTRAVLPDGASALYELSHAEHRHHLICSRCRKMVAVEGCPLEAFEKQLHDSKGFDITGHRLEIYGICADCRKGSQKDQ